MNLMMLLEMASSGFGDRTAFQNGSESWTFQELFNAAGAAANAISESGCERVALLDVNSLAIPLGVFGKEIDGPLDVLLPDTMGVAAGEISNRFAILEFPDP